MSSQIPMVDYLRLGDDPRLVAHECEQCHARYFDHRIACAACEGESFRDVEVDPTGEVKAFTIVSLAAPGIPVPFVAALIDCDGTSVQANLVDVEADPEHVTLGMKVALTTYSLGTDDQGVEAIGFGFAPVP
ncbi:MAG: hypothetical protein JWL73_1350 [Actinomycetia bacterium]|nr:hypothetical protein [Actinomycetes bacterium]